MKMQYWEPSPYAKCFSPDIEDAVKNLSHVVSNYGDYKKQFSPKMEDVVSRLTWKNVASHIVGLAK